MELEGGGGRKVPDSVPRFSPFSLFLQNLVHLLFLTLSLARFIIWTQETTSW